jgi:hypothetical protein
MDHNKNREIPKSRSQLVGSILKHGDLIYLIKTGDFNSNANNDAGNSQIISEEDEVDKILSKQDGRIQRQRDEQL